ncbi:MAG: TIGR02680 family protein [Acidobacteria bacterium]|nr:MAG: TIGR02680 family protein [Acidobacteriota bacterium]
MLIPSNAPVDTDYQIGSSVVANILRHIGVKPNVGHVWISTDGQWQNGPVRGCWNKPAAEYIGQAAREMARRRRMLELDSLIAEAQTCLDALIISVGELNWRDRAARSEADAAPIDEPVRAAYSQALAAAREVEAFRRRLAESEEHLERKQSRFDEATKKRDQTVVDLGIGNWLDSLDTVEAGISTYRLALSSFWPAVESFLDARTATQAAWTCLQEAGARERRQKETVDRLERAALAAEIAYDTLKEAVGADLDQTLQRLEEARRRLDGLRIKETETRQHHHDTELAVTRLDERLRNRTEILNVHTDRRDTAASALHTFACTRLLQLATPGIADEDALTWSTSRTVEVAFELASRLDSIESTDPVWEHLQKSVPLQFNELMRTLSAQGCQPSATFCDDVFVATAVFAGRECTMEELRHALYDEVSGRQMLLDAREKEILENHLAGEVSSHLHELFSAVEEQVQKMNVELETCPMSTGMKLRFVWRPAEDGPSGLTEVRRRLMQSTGWSSGDCALLGSFLQQQIQAVCSQIEGGTWQECLAEALDYRRWHWFGVERYQDGVWKRLTRRTHGTGSGGEKAIALTLPHFAAAAAFYRTADPVAPRLILLDEAFVGIDADMRAKCMGLIHAFDLDFIMTSEREWGCYQTLPGIAIYQLSTRPGIDAIGLTRWVWNGQHRVLKQNLASAENLTSLVASAK